MQQAVQRDRLHCLARICMARPPLLSVRRVLSQSVGERSLLLLAQSCGTVFRMTLHYIRDITDSVSAKTELKHIYFGSHIRTLFCSLFVAVLAMLVLAVTVTKAIKMSLQTGNL